VDIFVLEIEELFVPKVRIKINPKNFYLMNDRLTFSQPLPYSFKSANCRKFIIKRKITKIQARNVKNVVFIVFLIFVKHGEEVVGRNILFKHRSKCNFTKIIAFRSKIRKL
jgi:hypothetical protein